MPVSKVLINNLPHIHASLWKRTLCSTLDFLFVIAINIPIFLVIASMTGGTSDSVTLPNAYNLFPKPMTMLIFSVYMVFSFLIFFCFMPVYYGPQTLFSDLLNIRAITLDGTKPKMHEYFVSYFVVSFLVLFVNIIFFSMACSQELGIQYLLLNKYGTSSSAENDNMAEAWRYLVKLAFLALVLCQLHYFFTVALSKNKINWLTRWSNLVYIDLGKAKIFEFEIQDPAEIAVKPDADGMMLDEEEMLDEEDDYSEDDLDEDDEASEDGEEEDDLDEDDEASEDGEEEVEGEEDETDDEEPSTDEDETDDEEPSTDEDDK